MVRTMYAVLCACYIEGLELLVGQPRVWCQKNSFPIKELEFSGIGVSPWVPWDTRRLVGLQPSPLRGPAPVLCCIMP